MSLDVIGAGFGRTGTMSLKLALEQLGFAPCYHMVEVFEHPEHAPVWHDAAEGKPTDWHGLLGPYRAAVDWPVCHFWRELAEAFPDAKFLLTERDPESWYRSMSQTIFEFMRHRSEMIADPVRGPQARMSRLIVEEKTFAGHTDHDYTIAVYKAHNEAVKRGLPPERLLVYDVGQGWQPLCEFLGVAVPDAPFPRTNSSDEFRARIAELREQAARTNPQNR
jgi:hypothetical protein